MNSFFLLLPLLALPFVSGLSITGGPVVDLGYGLWKAALGTQDNIQYYNFSNIRYAAAPVGNLRFTPPQPPAVNRTIINDGQDGRVCSQGMPSWGTERGLFTKAYLADTHNVSEFTEFPLPGSNAGKHPPSTLSIDGRSTEDCLFLDVLVPTGVYGNSSRKNTGDKSWKRTGGAPVLVWIFGGGFYQGSSESQGDPAGLLARSVLDASPGVVYVAMNYRLGALGWLSGPTFSASGGTPNIGLYDQRFALEWVQRNIHLFGGDPNRVTVMGASAGAASAMHQITAYGGVDAPFQQAFLQSPAFAPNPYHWLQEESYQNFLAAANCTSLAELQALSSEEIMAANELVIWEGKYGSGGGYSPVVDGTFVPRLPSYLLQRGLRAKNVKALFSGHNTDEGLIFTNPAIQNDTAFNEWLHTELLPDAPPTVLSEIENTLYPPIYNDLAGFGYNDTISRLSTLYADLALTCNVYALLEAFGPNTSHAYLFEEGPSLHAEETPYTFYNYTATPDAYGYGDVNGTVAKELHDWVVAFGVTGDPNGLASSIPIQPYGGNRSMGVLTNEGLGLSAMDPAGKERCDFWIAGLYY